MKRLLLQTSFELSLIFMLKNRTFRLPILCLLCLACLSCKQQSKETKQTLDRVENLVEHQPDSALSLLASITHPEYLRKSQYHRYVLLQIQAKDKSYKDITLDTAIFNAKKYYAKNKDLPNAALAVFYCGRVRDEQKKQEEAMLHYLDAEKYANHTNNNNLKGLIQSAMGTVLFNQLLEDEAIVRYDQAVEYFHAAKNYKNEMIVYKIMGNCHQLKNNSESTSFCYDKAIKLANALRDSLQLANIKQSIGVFYKEKEDYNNAKRYFKEALRYSVSNEQSKIYLNLAEIFNLQNHADSAEWYMQKSINALHDQKDLYLLASIYNTFSEIKEKKGDYSKALKYHKEYANSLSSIFDENKNNTVMEIQKKYQFELVKNEKDELALQKQKILFYSSILVIILLLIILFLYRNSMKSKKNELEAERKIYHLMNMAKDFDEKESSFRNTLLHHFEILKKAAFLENYLRREDSVRGKYLIKKFNEIVYGQENLNWDMLYQAMNDLHNGFFDHLREIYPQLDKAEFRICCLTYSKFTNSEIAIIIGQSINTIQMKKASIRKKLNIVPRGNIQEYLNKR